MNDTDLKWQRSPVERRLGVVDGVEVEVSLVDGEHRNAYFLSVIFAVNLVILK